MPVTIVLSVTDTGFVPASPSDQEQKELFPVGAQVRASITRGRSRPMERFYWAMVQMVAQGIGYEKEALSNDLLVGARLVDSFHLKNGWTKIVPKRISKMGQEDFKMYVDQAIDQIITTYLPDMKRNDLLAEVESMVGISYEAAIKPPKGMAHGLQ